MRRHSLLLLTILALCVTAPIKAQLVNPVTLATEPQATPDSVVARLMTFDRNHDGRVARAELPERMLGLLTRGDVSKDDALDATEVRKLAVAPAPPVAVRGLQPGQYGFGEDFDLDTRLHIDGAIEDLRLASATRDQALAIGRAFVDKSNEQAKADLLATMEGLLTPEQLAQVKALLGRRVSVVQFSQRPGEALPREALEGNVPRELARRIVMVAADPTRIIQTFDLAPEQKKAALVAVEQFKSRKTLSDADRSALLQQLRALLDDQQRDDLRAALERRPIVKQHTNVIFSTATQTLPPTAVPQTAEPDTSFAIRDLVLRQ